MTRNTYGITEADLRKLHAAGCKVIDIANYYGALSPTPVTVRLQSLGLPITRKGKRPGPDPAKVLGRPAPRLKRVTPESVLRQMKIVTGVKGARNLALGLSDDVAFWLLDQIRNGETLTDTIQRIIADAYIADHPQQEAAE